MHAVGSKAGPFCGSYLESHKVIPKKELLRGLWVDPKPSILSPFFEVEGRRRASGSHGGATAQQGEGGFKSDPVPGV